jgi:processive 1,2-diacylglycerol beta-glucosyltransferase
VQKINIIILTTKGGQGLISGSEAIKESIEKLRKYNCKVKIIDFFDKGSLTGKCLTAIYNFFLRNSLLLNYCFTIIINRLRIDKWKIFYRKSLKYYCSIINELEPDIIIVTSQYLVSFLAYASRLLNNNIPVYSANIDPGKRNIPLWFHNDIHLHVLPCNDTMEAYLQYGFPGNKAVVSSLTVRQEFLEVRNWNKDALKEELELPHNKFIILLSGSREGYKGMLPLIKQLITINGVYIVAICGTNNKLKTKLEKLANINQSKIKVMGFCKCIHKYMKASDIIISKPGKQTMKESLSVGTPLISITFPIIMDQEKGNIEFMKRRGVCFEANSKIRVMEYVKMFQNDIDFYKLTLDRINKVAGEEINPDNVGKTMIEDYLSSVVQESI